MRQSSRRAFLSAVTGCGLTLAGCSTISQSTSPPTDSAAPITALDVTGEAIAVELAPDADVSELSLIGPDGEAVTSTTVTAGETRVTVPILDVSPGTADYEHYTPGDHELVATVAGEEFAQSLSLEPDIELVAVEQYRDGSSPADLGRLSARVANRGTGPTWVHDITFEGAPNPDANDTLIEEPGVPQVSLPTGDRNTSIAPNEEIHLLTSESPLLFQESDEEGCNLDFSCSMLIGTPMGRLQTDLSIDTGGEKQALTMVDSYVCDSVDIRTTTGSRHTNSDELEQVLGDGAI